MNRGFGWTLLIYATIASGCASSQQSASTQPGDPLTYKLDSILHRQDKSGATFTARIIDLSNGRELYAHEIDTPYTPASNLKLFTTSTALDRFGPDKVFKTYLAKDGDNLWVIGEGDPSLGDQKLADRDKKTITAMFDDWLDALRKKKIDHISGKLYFFQNSFERLRIHPTWSRGYLTDWYAAPVSGLTFNDNCVDITLYPTEKGEPARYEIVPPVKNIEITNKTVTASTQPAEITRAEDRNWYRLTGGVTKKDALESKAVVDPGAFFADAFRTHLESHGFKIDGPTVEATDPLGGHFVPPADKIIATHETKLTDILWRINKHSQNLFAECLSKLNGQDFRAQHGDDVAGSWEDGASAARAFLKSRNIDDGKITLLDGCGLSRQDRVTSHAITDILASWYLHPNGRIFRSTLPIGGVDGTISKRMKDIAGKVQAKTGYIGGVRALSGYIDTKSGKTLAFSIIFNHIPEHPGAIKPFEDIQDDACRFLYNWSGYEAPSPTTMPGKVMTAQR